MIEEFWARRILYQDTSSVVWVPKIQRGRKRIGSSTRGSLFNVNNLAATYPIANVAWGNSEEARYFSSTT